MARWACDIAWGITPGFALLLTAFAAIARADTLKGALINAYQSNPQLNSRRAVVRETDESVPQALSGYKPSLSATAQVGPEYLSTISKTVGPTGAPVYPRTA